MSTLREMVSKNTAENLEKVHDHVAKLNDDLRYLRGVDLDELDEQQFTMLVQLIESLGKNLPLMSVLLDVAIVRKLKENENER